MADELSLPNLLSLLQVEPQNSVVQQLCDEAETLRRRRFYDSAIAKAENAEQLARGEDYNQQGVALLYLSLARWSSGLQDQQDRAALDCDRAITSFALEPHNRAVAAIMRAQIELIANGNDPDRKIRALRYYQRAAHLLDELKTDWRVPNHLIQVESDLLTAVNTKIAELATLNDSPKTLIQSAPYEQQRVETPPTSAASTLETPSINLPVPTYLVWPTLDSPGLQMRVTAVSMPEVSLDQSGFVDKMKLEGLQINQISINGEQYIVCPIISPPNPCNPVWLRVGCRYFAFRMQDDQTNRYVLVRLQNQSDQVDQKVAVTAPAQKRVWIDKESNLPRILGSEDVSQAEDKQGREFHIADGSEGPPFRREDIRIIGVAEAVLQPSKSPDSSSISTSIASSQPDNSERTTGKESASMQE
jgi:hypothetical protein